MKKDIKRIKSEIYNIFFIFNLSISAPNGRPRIRKGATDRDDIIDKLMTELFVEITISGSTNAIIAPPKLSSITDNKYLLESFNKFSMNIPY